MSHSSVPGLRAIGKAGPRSYTGVGVAWVLLAVFALAVPCVGCAGFDDISVGRAELVETSVGLAELAEISVGRADLDDISVGRANLQQISVDRANLQQISVAD